MSESGANNDVKFPLKVTVNKQKTKVLFAEVDSSFADVLLSFLTLPLGTTVRILQKHYKYEAPAFGSLATLYKALSNLDSAKFWTEGAKSILLHPRSTFDAPRKGLKLDISDSPPLEGFVCSKCWPKFKSLSMYYDKFYLCPFCISDGDGVQKERKKDAQICGESFTASTISFLITDNLQIIPNIGLLQIGNFLGTSDMDNAELLNATLGFAEVMDLLKASLISNTPLSDVILKTRSYTNYRPTTKIVLSGNTSTPNSKKLNLKLVVQKSTNKLVHAEAEEDFVEFLFGLLIIPLGKVESLLKNNSGIKAIDNLHKSVADHMKDKYFNHLGARASLIEPKVPHGYNSKSNVLPCTEACLSDSFYNSRYYGLSIKFPKGQGNYLVGPHIYKVEDDLTVTPFCVSSILSSLKKLKISMSDVKEVQLQIGLEEGLRILKASLTSTCAVTDALLLDHVANKQPKPEP